ARMAILSGMSPTEILVGRFGLGALLFWLVFFIEDNGPTFNASSPHMTAYFSIASEYNDRLHPILGLKPAI
ncbi:MAG: hypothetical protein AAF394_11385, partial [Planctomycetota bacterium]